MTDRRGLALLLTALVTAGCFSPFGDDAPGAETEGEDGNVSSTSTGSGATGGATQGPAGKPTGGGGVVSTSLPGAPNVTGNQSWSKLARTFEIPGEEGYAVVRVDLTGADGEPSEAVPGNVTHSVRLQAADGATTLYARFYRVEGDVLTPRTTTLTHGDAAVLGFSMNATANVTVIIVAHLVGEKLNLTVGAGNPMPENRTAGQALAIGNDGTLAYALESSLVPGTGDRHNVEYTESGAASSLVRAGTFQLSTDHATTRPSLHTTFLRVSSTAGAGSVKLERAFDSDSETHEVQVQHAAFVGTQPPTISREVVVQRSAGEVLTDTNDVSAFSSITLYSVTTPWDPASLGLRLAEPE